MNVFSLTISSPDGTLFQGDALALSLRGANGDLAILAGHAPFITSVKPGHCKITLPDETQRHATVNGGMLTVVSNTATLLTDELTWQEEA